MNESSVAFDRGRTLVTKTILTPEGTPLTLGVARMGDRMAAAVIDLLLITLPAIVLAVSGLLLFANGLGFALVSLIAFALRIGYFSYWELRGNGATPGKRRLGIRVVEAEGGQLSTEAILTRNFMRELEFWLPIQVLSSPETYFPEAPGGLRLIAILWVVALVCIPLLNPDRRRAGDFVAGTMVGVLPSERLLADLGRQRKALRPGAALESEFNFTREQLEIYGIYELEVLEEVLRTKGRGQREAFKTVAAKICRKIEWEGPVPDDAEAFLRAFYRAQRERLEQGLLMGRRKERKSSEAGGGPPRR